MENEERNMEKTTISLAMDVDQLAIIRNVMAAHLDKKLETGEDCGNDLDLEIINKIQQAMDCPTFSDLEQYRKNTSDSWGTITW